MSSLDPHAFLHGLFQAALSAVRAEERAPVFLSKIEKPKGKTIVVGAGKAAASMAKAVEDHFGDIDSGLVVTRYKHGLPLKKIEVVEAGHPMPDDSGQRAAARILELAGTAGPDDLLLCLISGGGSALLSLPAQGLTMADMQAVTKGLLLSGANIGEINCVRKHISAIAGGRLARAAKGARIVSLLISDVPGDDVSVIASGPTVADPTTFADALAVLKKHNVSMPPAIEKHLTEAREESVKPGDPCLARAETIMIATPQDALDAAAAYAKAHGVTPLILGNAIEGEARDVALVMAGMARQVVGFDQPLPAPCVLISGGETTVTVKGKGKGGRNCEFLLNLAIATDGHPRIHAIACDTDGIDGTEDNAGAILHPDTLAKGLAKGAKAKDYAARNDSYSFFEFCDSLVITEPTRTNVNDFRAVYIKE
ncbi:MAG: glycerate kinase [Alphaproteobacteria bacterium]|nr:glycerate kinase [Alphaproteobacteria bacterium]